MSILNLFRKEKCSYKLLAVASGKVCPIESVQDEVFSAKILGDGLALEPDNSQSVLAPASGVVTVADHSMPHAVGMRLSTGMEILIHIGIDTVEMDGHGFRLLAEKGEKVKVGQPLIAFDLDAIRSSGHPGTIILVVTEPGQHKPLFLSGLNAVAGQTVIAEYQ